MRQPASGSGTSRGRPPRRPVQRYASDLDTAASQGRARADDHPVSAGVLADHVQRLAAGHPDPAPLPDREEVLSLVRAKHPPVKVDDLPAPAAPEGVAPMAAQERPPVGARQEAP